MSTLNERPTHLQEGLPAVERPPIEPTAIAELFANVAHDLRSPLGVVTQTLGEIRADLAGALTDDHRRLMALADRGVLRLARIADTMSLVAALEGHGFEPRLRPINLVEILKTATVASTVIEPRREVMLVCDLPETPCYVAADSERLSRAFSEMIINAIRHARGRARICFDTLPSIARVAIEDDGQGVPIDLRSIIFQRFVTRRTRSGLGLGLSIAHDLIVAHGGRLELEVSTLPPGRPGTAGARFVSTFPILEDST